MDLDHLCVVPNQQGGGRGSRSRSSASQPECDYDRTCTPLYTQIEREEWDVIIELFETGYWPGSMSILPDYSIKTQAMTVVVKRVDPTDPDKVSWRRLPLQLAVMLRAPLAVVRGLVELYPQGCHWADHHGYLALHLSLLFNASDDVVAYLLTATPEHISRRAYLGSSPLVCALRADDKTRGQVISMFVKYTRAPPKKSRSSNNDADGLTESALLSRKAKAPQKELECDFDRNASPLYKKIDAGDWVSILEFLEKGYWKVGPIWTVISYCFLDEATPEEQVRTWITQKQPNGKDSVLWSQLPLHVCLVCGAPDAIINRMIDMYPQSVYCADDQGMLPLHLALYFNASDNTIIELLRRFPESLNKVDSFGRTPLGCALCSKTNAYRGKMLQMFVERTLAKDIPVDAIPRRKAMTSKIGTSGSNNNKKRSNHRGNHGGGAGQKSKIFPSSIMEQRNGNKARNQSRFKR